MRVAVPIVALVLAGCRKVEPAPEDLDGLLAWLWANGFTAGDEDLRDAVDGMLEATGEGVAEGPMRGSLTGLSAEAVEGYAPEGQAVEEAAGVFLVNPFPCALVDLEPVLYERDQASLYLDIYESYDRTYTSDFDAYVGREAPLLTWDIELVATLLGSTYTEVMSGGLRYLPADGERPAALVQRTWLLEPAVFETGNKRFEQDYQVELYVESSPGTVVHAYAFWRDMFLGAGFSSEDDIVINTTLNNLEDWDERTSALCLGTAE